MRIIVFLLLCWILALAASSAHVDEYATPYEQCMYDQRYPYYYNPYCYYPYGYYYFPYGRYYEDRHQYERPARPYYRGYERRHERGIIR